MKVVVMRFSSFGDVLQTLSVAGRIGESWPEAEIHWVTRAEYAPMIQAHPKVHQVWTLSKGAGFWDVWNLGGELRRQGFTHVYDAHNNLRSRILGWRLNGLFGWRRLFFHRFLRRPIYRVRRFFLFKFRWNLFPKPFSGQGALLAPLAAWGLPVEAPAVPQLRLPDSALVVARHLLPAGWDDFVTLAPSAAFELKRWPLEYWIELIRRESDTRFVVLGGPEDGFLHKLVEVDPTRVCNLAGQLSLEASAQVVAMSRALVANDTGLMHVAEQRGVPCLALMGPAPFGFPSRPSTQIFQLDLACRPCSKHGQGPCVNPEFQLCLRGISAEQVSKALHLVLDA
jgi:ADP-heptose:LPS heptosyltransferase